jgi:hypothetical protein
MTSKPLLAKCCRFGDKGTRATRLILAIFLASLAPAKADLIVTVRNQPNTSNKLIVKLKMRNTFSERITSARATIFLRDDSDKVVARSTKWVIGGGKNQPPLDPKGTTEFNFVIPVEKPFSKWNLSFSRIVLEGGKVVDPTKSVVIEK